MKRTLLILGAGLLAAPVLAQGPMTTTVPKVKIVRNYKPGRFQLADGQWQAGELHYQGGEKLRARQPDVKGRQEYLPHEVKRFVIGADTFGIMLGHGPAYYDGEPKTFAQQLYRTPYHTLYWYRETEDSPVGTTLLEPAGDIAVRVPSGRAAFTAAMLPVFGQCPELAESIRKGKLGPQHLKRIMASYARWRATAPAQP